MRVCVFVICMYVAALLSRGEDQRSTEDSTKGEGQSEGSGNGRELSMLTDVLVHVCMCPLTCWAQALRHHLRRCMRPAC